MIRACCARCSKTRRPRRGPIPARSTRCWTGRCAARKVLACLRPRRCGATAPTPPTWPPCWRCNPSRPARKPRRRLMPRSSGRPPIPAKGRRPRKAVPTATASARSYWRATTPRRARPPNAWPTNTPATASCSNGCSRAKEKSCGPRRRPPAGPRRSRSSVTAGSAPACPRSAAIRPRNWPTPWRSPRCRPAASSPSSPATRAHARGRMPAASWSACFPRPK